MLPALRHATPALLFLSLLGVSRAADTSLKEGDVARGRTLFLQTCGLCHATGQEKRPTAGLGPFLGGVVGRPAASVPGFGYTKALKASGLTWDAPTLDRFLANPQALVPATAMVVMVPAQRDRNDLIAFLATLRPAAPRPSAAYMHTPRRGSTPGDYQNDAPGNVHQVKVADLPAPYATISAGNAPSTVDRPAGAQLAVPPGFQVKLFASDLSGPRLMRTAPNGDVFVAETRAGRIHVLRAPDGADQPSESSVFADGLSGPFGIAFYPLGDNPQWVYVGNLNSVVRYPYHNGDLKATGPAEIVVPLLADSNGGHTTRDLAFSPDGRRLFVSIGSGSNIADGLEVKNPEQVRAWEAEHGFGSSWGYENHRAMIMQTDPEGRAPLRPFATGIRNPVGIAIQPATGQLWCSTNERDDLGDDLVPDYITHVQEGAFYGWPWYYMGNHEDPRHAGERPDLAGKVTAPDVPEQAHSASLELSFYPTEVAGPGAFPAEYRGEPFVALHGSWNRTGRTGAKVVRAVLKDGVATGEYIDFLTGFVVDDAHVWGRPVGLATTHDGSLLVSEDANSTIWRISYVGH
jgi:glucose/arabinose dehydrogenase